MSDSMKRRPGHEHIPNYPKGWVAIRIVQLVLALALVGLGAYAATRQAWAGPILTIWGSICTFIITIWLISAHTCAPGAFNYWAVLILDIYLYIIWLGSMAACAILAGAAFGGRAYTYSNKRDSYDYDYGYSSYSYSYYSSDALLKYYGRDIEIVTAAAAGLAAAEFLLFFICIIVNAVVIHRHRKAGLHARKVRNGQGVGWTSTAATSYQAVPQQGVPLQQTTAYAPTYQPQAQFQPNQHNYYGAPSHTPPPPQQLQQQTAYVSPQPAPASIHPSVSPAGSYSPYTAPQHGMPAPQPYEPGKHY